VHGVWIGDVIGLNDEVQSICAPEYVAQMNEINQGRKVLGHIILEVGVYLDQGVGIDAGQGEKEGGCQHQMPSLYADL